MKNIKNKNIKLFFSTLLVFSFFSYLAFATEDLTSVLSLQDIEKINKNLKYDRLNIIKDGKVEIEQIPERIFLFSKERYYSNVTYSGQIRKVSSKNESFFERWMRAKYMNENSLRSGNVDTNIVLINNQIDFFYKELLVYEGGKLYNFIIQIPLAQKMEKELTKGNKIQIEFINIGKDVSNGDNFFVITNFSRDNLKKEVTKENDFLNAKRMIRDNQYDAAIAKLNTFLKKYPNHMEARKEICGAKYLKSIRGNNANKMNVELIKCYEDVAKFYENETVFYMLAMLYYNNTTFKLTERQKNVLLYANKAISILNNKGISESLKIIYYNSIYLRGMVKVAMNNTDGYSDLKIVQDERPDLVTLDLYLK